MVFAQAARTIGPWQKGMGEMFSFVNGNFVHSHSLFISEALLELQARRMYFGRGRTDV